MLDTIRKYWKRINPYHGIIFFVIALFASNYFWEFTVSGDEEESTIAVSFLCFDLSSFFRWCVLWFTACTHAVLDFFGTAHFMANNIIGFSNGHSMHVIPGCTAVKQLFIALCILAFSRGPHSHKLWYIPCSLLFLVGFNIFRLTVLSLVVRDYVEYFEFFHVVVLKYLFYANILLLWFLWDEYIRFR